MSRDLGQQRQEGLLTGKEERRRSIAREVSPGQRYWEGKLSGVGGSVDPLSLVLSGEDAPADQMGEGADHHALPSTEMGSDRSWRKWSSACRAVGERRS